jgi:hypothetical protein
MHAYTQPGAPRSLGSNAEEVARMFRALEADFKKLSQDSDGLVLSSTLSSGVRKSSRIDKIAALSRLQFALNHADKSSSSLLDFFEYVNTAFLLTTSGSYSEYLNNGSADPVHIKKVAMDIRRRYK